MSHKQIESVQILGFDITTRAGVNEMIRGYFESLILVGFDDDEFF